MRLLILSLVITLNSAANILFFAYIPAPSHLVVFQPIWHQLASGGHNVTVLSAGIQNESIKNLREVDMSFIYEFTEKYPLTSAASRSKCFSSELLHISKVFEWISTLLETELQHESVKQFLNETNHFDVIVAEIHSPMVFALGHKYGAPVIGRKCILEFV